jgi:hypothetical protein
VVVRVATKFVSLVIALTGSVVCLATSAATAAHAAASRPLGFKPATLA